jgi:hypothetical protein
MQVFGRRFQLLQQKRHVRLVRLGHGLQLNLSRVAIVLLEHGLLC